MDAGWDKDMLLQGKAKQERGRVKSNKSRYMTSMLFSVFLGERRLSHFAGDGAPHLTLNILGFGN